MSGYLREGDEIFSLAKTDSEVAGMLTCLEQDGAAEIVPLVAARANSSGPLTRDCHGFLTAAVLDPLRRAGPVDGVLLSHHGSMVAEDEDDPEGALATRVREVVGEKAQIIMTLDLHANVTARMIEETDAVVGYEHYPHDDSFATGVRAAELLLCSLRSQIRPVTARARLPLLLTAFNGSTLGDGPFARLMREAKHRERRSLVVSSSLFLVGSYIDVPEMGCSAVVVTDDDPALAAAEAEALARAFWDAREEFGVETMSVKEAIRRGRSIEGGPVLLLDTADTTGGGAAGDSIHLLRELLSLDVEEPTLCSVVDPAAASKCHEAGVGRHVSLDLGHAQDPRWGSPISVKCQVLHLSDGAFSYSGGVLGGAGVSMGPSAVVEIGSVQVLVSSLATYEWGDEQYKSMGLAPERAKFVGVKNMMNFRRGYRDSMKAFFVLDLPGPTPPDMRSLSFTRVNRPTYPLDELAGEVVPDVAMSRRSPVGAARRASTRGSAPGREQT